MTEALSAAFSGSPWPLYLLVYLIIGWALLRPSGTFWDQLISTIGWPIEMTQRLSGATGLPYLFLLPNMIVFGLFTFAPLFINMGFSVTEGQSILFSDREWAGLDNLRRLLSETQIDTGAANLEDDKFLSAVYDTATFVVFQVPIMIAVALISALALNRKIVARGLWRAVFFYPVMLSPVVVGFLWSLILKRQGVLSETLMRWGWLDEPIQWLTDPSWTMFWSVFVYTWAHLGFYMLILLAGLQAIPRDVYEAAEMDGTPAWRQLTRITIPLLAPTLLVVTVLSLVKAFQAFEELYAMSVRWTSLVGYIFETSGLRGQPTANGLGIAAMASLLVAVVLIMLSLLQVYLSSKSSKP
ncbi:alpha-1,4-digalacturonate transport system permease protein [Yoonia maritima]|uniref:Alpha-1,4-digalacturonate transport system permease protein n=1 Tax=Yoonia maritima TaxID=1435347 RepID=A0A2T0VZP1_9RHOB|nr:sugar ABC transporter permease [Yoonia maritima]PRY77803.1 alpha-1,4-digalacturonate transport system permease protein [Yoonia maritima]